MQSRRPPKSRLLPLVLLVAVAAFGVGRYARTEADPATLGVVDYRTALEQLGAGHAQSAQLLLESSQARGDLAPENALLLAYLQERAGQNDRARTTLGALGNPSPLAQAYLVRLGGPTLATGGETAPAPRDASSASANPSRLATSDARIAKLEKEMLALVNATRQGQGMRALTWDDTLAEVARAHSAEMRDKNYFAHQSPSAKLRDPLDRYAAGLGATPRLVAENIYRAWGSASSLNSKAISTGHTALMNSPGHRANILLDGATRIGIGIVANSKGDIWITQMFSKP